MKRDLWDTWKETCEIHEKRPVRYMKRDLWDTWKETYEIHEKRPMRYTKRDVRDTWKETCEIASAGQRDREVSKDLYTRKETYETDPNLWKEAYNRDLWQTSWFKVYSLWSTSNDVARVCWICRSTRPRGLRFSKEFYTRKETYEIDQNLWKEAYTRNL